MTPPTPPTTRRTTPKKNPSEKVVSDIHGGIHDEHLADISQAISSRVRAGIVAFRWRITLPDLSIDEDDLTLQEALAFETEVGTTWLNLEPLTSAAHAYGLLVTLYQSRHGLTRDEVVEKLAPLKMRDYLDAVTAYAATENPPQAPAA